MKEWKNCTLGELGKIVGGATPSTKRFENYEGGTIPWITPKDLSGFFERYIAQGERNITEAGLQSCSAQLLSKHSILFSSRAPIGYIAIAACEVCTNQGFKSIIPNNDVDYMFLYYLLKFKKGEIENMGSGTTFKEVSAGVMKNIQVRVPAEKSVQIKIAKILSSLDDKIELNNRINDNLAALLQTIYQQEFGDVDSAFEEGKLSDICSYSKDRIAVSSLDVWSYYSTENMLPGKLGATEATNLPTTTQTTACHVGDTLISNIRPYFKKIVYCQRECGCSTDVLCFTPFHANYSAYLFSTLYSDSFFNFMVAGSKGTKMPRGDKQQIMTYPVALPSNDELNTFNSAAFPILAQIHSNQIENESLSTLRDNLLPKFMSGEIDVSSVKL